MKLALRSVFPLLFQGVFAGTVIVEGGGQIQMASGAVLSVGQGGAEDQPATPEIVAWRAIYAALGGTDCTLSGCTDLLNDPCACSGHIGCDGDIGTAEGHIVNITIRGATTCQLNGYIPARLAELSRLEVLDISSVIVDVAAGCMINTCLHNLRHGLPPEVFRSPSP